LSISLRQAVQAARQVAEAVVDVHAELLKGGTVLGEERLEEGLNAVPEDLRVRHLRITMGLARC
jgi:hypothetical protein